MKQAIKKLDGDNNQQKKPSSDTNLGVSNNAFDFDRSQNLQKSQHEPKVEKKPSNNNRMSVSVNDFDDFANFANMNKPVSASQ